MSMPSHEKFSNYTQLALLVSLSHKLHTYTDIHRFAGQPGLQSIHVLGSIVKCTAQHAGHLNIRLLSVMLYSK